MRFSAKVCLIAVSSVLGSQVLQTAAISYREARDSLSELRNRHRLLATLAASQVEAGYHEQFWPFEMLSTLAREPTVVSWRIVDGQGRSVLSNLGIEDPLAEHVFQPAREPTLVEVGSGRETWIVPVRARTDGEAWNFRLGFETRSVRERIARLVAINALSALAVSCLIALVAVSLTRRFLRPLNALMSATENLGEGRMVALPAQAGQDEVGQLVGAFRGMTQRLAERDVRINEQMRAIRAANERLEFRVRERTAELEAATRVAESATEAKSRFLANMSHEIRTPMTAILGYADLLAEGDMGEAERSESVECIQSCGSHLLTIINDVLDFSKIEAGEMDVAPVVCSPLEVLHDVLRLLRDRADQQGTELELRFEGRIPRTLLTDPMRLRQILINLIGNAIKFTIGGRVTVTAALEESGDRVAFRVHDTGIGMTPAQQEQLFQPFTQADASTTRTFGGTGLGLTISRELARLLGGDIAVSSVQGEGSTFTLTVDRGPSEGVELIAPEATDLERRAPRAGVARVASLAGHILLAEDNAVNARLLVAILERSGARVTLARDGLEALEAVHAQAGAFDLVLMDVQMPRMDGKTAVVELRAEGLRLPILALTANATREDREACLVAGFDDFLTKPVDQRTFMAKCAYWLSAAGQRGGGGHSQAS